METSISQDDISRLNDKDKAELRDFIEKEAKRTKFQARMFCSMRCCCFHLLFCPSPFSPLFPFSFFSPSSFVPWSQSVSQSVPFVYL